MAEIKRIIEFQPGKQRTPQEALDFVQDEIDNGLVDKVLIICTIEEPEAQYQYYVPAAKNRNYKKSRILWDLEQFKRAWLRE